MKTSEAQELIRGMVKEEKLTYDPKRGLVLTEKIAGIGLAFLCELSTEQVSRIGQEFDPLFPTRKRLKSLANSGVSVDALRAMLDELEGKTPTPKLPDTDKETEPEGEKTGDLFKPNGWEQVEAEQLGKEAENAEDNKGELSVQGETTDPGTGGSVPIEGHSTEGVSQESGSGLPTDNIQQAGPRNTGRRPRNTGNESGAGGTV